MNRLSKTDILNIVFAGCEHDLSPVVPLDRVPEGESMYYVMQTTGSAFGILWDLREVVNSKLLTTLHDDPTQIFAASDADQRLSIDRIELYPGLRIPANEQNFRNVMMCLGYPDQLSLIDGDTLSLTGGVALRSVYDEEAAELWEKPWEQRSVLTSVAA